MAILAVKVFRKMLMFTMKYPAANQKHVNGNGKKVYQKKVEFFAWEKLDYVDKIKKEFKL